LSRTGSEYQHGDTMRKIGSGVCLAALCSGLSLWSFLLISLPWEAGGSQLADLGMPAPDRPLAEALTDPPPPLVIAGATLIDGLGGTPRDGKSIVIENHRIVAIGGVEEVVVPEGATVIDASGKYVIPGLIETHGHLWLGRVWSEDFWDSEVQKAVLGLYLAHGITSLRDASSQLGSGGLEGPHVDLREAVKRGDLLGPRIYVSGTVSWGNMTRLEADDLPDLVRTLASLGVDGIKVRDRFGPGELREIVRAASLEDLPVFGHFGLAGGDAAEVYAGGADRLFGIASAGMNGITHVLSIPVVSTDPPPAPDDSQDGGSMWLWGTEHWIHSDPAVMDALIDTLVARDVWLEPTLTTEDWMTRDREDRRTPDGQYLPVDFEEFQDWFPELSEDGRQRYRLAMDRMEDFVRRFHEAGGTLITGSDNLPAPAVGLHRELWLLQEAGIPPGAVIQAATRNAARAMGWDEEVGTVEVGKRADLVLLRDDPLVDIGAVREIHAVVVDGRHLDLTKLDTLLEEARIAAARARRGY